MSERNGSVAGVVFVDGEYRAPFDAVKHLVASGQLPFRERWTYIRQYQRKAGVPVTPEPFRTGLMRYRLS